METASSKTSSSLEAQDTSRSPSMKDVADSLVSRIGFLPEPNQDLATTRIDVSHSSSLFELEIKEMARARSITGRTLFDLLLGIRAWLDESLFELPHESIRIEHDLRGADAALGGGCCWSGSDRFW